MVRWFYVLPTYVFIYVKGCYDELDHRYIEKFDSGTVRLTKNHLNLVQLTNEL